LISILIVNPLRSPEPSMVLTGDSLLVGDVGRPDFGGGDVAAQYDSLTNLLRLPDWVAVFPGHFEGPCGQGMCGRPSTTIGFERLYNPLARLDRREFITRVGRGVPPRPLNMTAIEATNRGQADMAWAMLTSSPEVREVSLDDVRGRPSDAAVIDVREPEEFASGHVPGAVNLPQADLATRLDEVPRDRPVLVICQGGFRSLRAAQFLRQRGFADVASVQGGTEAWRAAGGAIILESAHAPQPGIVETEWTHAGGDSYSI
jgi:rhodanese-related sulfurtransferase